MLESESMEQKIKDIFEENSAKIKASESLAELDKIFLALFGKNGKITLIPKDFSTLIREQKKQIGPLFNKVKLQLEQDIETQRAKVRNENYKALTREKFTIEPQEFKPKKRQGHLHIATQFKQEIVTLFGKLGFLQFDAPHVEWDKYNFEDLNIPKDHPSRDMWDTWYIDTKNSSVEPGSMLMRTHTSNFWPRLMEKACLPAGRLKLPIRAMSYDRCFRYEAIDARHEHTFDQFEIAVVGKDISMANLKYLSDYFLKAILGPEAKSRFRPKYYPFVEPGVGIDCLCIFCHGKGCRICSGVGWFEIAGAGMIHPNVLKNTGLDPKKYTGLAWGFGPYRMMMLKHAINDIRSFLEGDLNFLQKY